MHHILKHQYFSTYTIKHQHSPTYIIKHQHFAMHTNIYKNSLTNIPLSHLFHHQTPSFSSQQATVWKLLLKLLITEEVFTGHQHNKSLHVTLSMLNVTFSITHFTFIGHLPLCHFILCCSILTVRTQCYPLLLFK